MLPLRLMLVCFICVTLAGCGLVETKASYPTRPEASGSNDIVYSDQERDTIFGKGRSLSDTIFGTDEDQDTAGASGIGVNSFLWRASLDTVSFLPLQSADPFGGVILTEWYEDPQTPGERFKINVYILDQQLRADGIRVAVFKQEASGNNWRDVAVPDDMEQKIENTILTRARDLRLQQSAAR